MGQVSVARSVTSTFEINLLLGVFAGVDRVHRWSGRLCCLRKRERLI